ncbi:MAG: glycosyltransferase [Rhabdochlamydiaceae bacterium]|nr:glycosyltransferase [Rhabdochlamydiaceae bacterium]
MLKWIGFVVLTLIAGVYMFYTRNQAAAIQQPRKICLNMIVKNESAVIRRCIDSVRPLIDYWVIVDTGSTDGTQKIIKNHLKDIPGELYQRPWKNFEHNRNEALEFAKGKSDYILFMDADDILDYEEGFELPALEKDRYDMWQGTNDFASLKPQLVKSNKPWKWVGVTHEYLNCDEPFFSETLNKVRYITGSDGASRSDPKKFYKNIELLEEGLKKEPNNHRYVFYMAESYRDAGEKIKALEWYQKVVDMRGWDQEMFYALLQIGHLLRSLGFPSSVIIESYQRAHHFRPHRIEPLYYMAQLYNEQQDYEKAYFCIKAAQNIPKPDQKDVLFNEFWIEKYGLLFQLSICSYYLKYYDESLKACDDVISLQDIPEAIKQQAVINRSFAVSGLASVSVGD